MNNLKFKSLRILSDIEKKANQFNFGDRFNLIVGTTNSVGKSHIVKNLFWALGCEPYLDPNWKELDCKVVVEFSVGSDDYRVARQGERIFFAKGKAQFESFPKITGRYSEKFARLVNYHVLLPVRDKEEITTPPPAYYFLPFYINQTHSWSKAWNSFENLGQFSNWQREVIQYHVGITKRPYYELTEEIYNNKRERTDLDEQISRIDTAINVVSQFIPDVETTLDVNVFENIKKELEFDVGDLHKKQEAIFERLAILRADKEHVDNQLLIAQRAVSELEQDYEYALKDEEEIECPTCGVVHDNTLVNRFSILSDKDQAEQVVVRLKRQSDKLTKEISKATEELNVIKQRISELNKKYIKSEEKINASLQDVLDSVAVGAVRTKVSGHRKEKAQDLYDVEKNIEMLKHQQEESAEETRKIINETFQSLYPALTEKLHAYGVNASAIKGPLNYSKVAKSGGDAERTRAMLAYYLTIYNLVDQFSDEVLGPFIIDTPRQHEQASAHYDRIVSVISQNTPKSSQIFLCGMDSDQLDPIKQQGNVIMLEKERSLLDKSKYDEIKEYIGDLFEEEPA